MNTTGKELTYQQRALLFLFFISGFAALLYQVVWQRWLVFYTGIGIVSISLIVSAFMVGLGIGYVVGGAIADRSKKSKTLLYFVIAEIGIGTFALLSKSIFYDFLYNSELLSFSNSFMKTYTVLFLSLVFPTFLMGLSLPLLSKAFELRSVHDQTDFLNHLYFVNTFGAATGAFISGILLMQLFGMQVTVYCGVILNYTCAILSFVIYRKETRQSTLGTSESKDIKITKFVWNKNFIFWILQYFTSGFAALSLELLWFRILDNSIKSLSITFSILLSIYLLSMALGTFFGVKVSLIEKVNKTKIFLLAQYVLYFTAIFSIVLFLYSVKNVGLLSFLSDYFRSYDLKLELSSLPIIVTVYLVLPVFLMSIPTFLMGFSFAISQKIVQDSFAEVGRKVGFLQAVNIAGSTIGTWFVTFIGFKYLGSSLTIRLICCLCVAYLSILMYKRLINLKLYIPVLLLTTVIIISLPTNNSFWNILGGVDKPGEMIYNEDETAVSSIVCIKGNSCIGHYVFANGLGQSELPLSIDLIHVLIGTLPTLIHPDPKHVAAIGLGSGGTLYGMSCRSTTKNIDCYEVITNQPATLQSFADRYNDSSIQALFTDKRISMIMKDGRYAIHKGKKRYDIIEADALRPLSSYSGNIYSREYFDILSKKLTDNGIVATWVPTARVKETFCEVFPVVYEIGDFLLVGSNSYFEINRDKIFKMLNDQFTKQHFEKGNINIETELRSVLQNVSLVQSEKKSASGSINTDLFPRDEYAYFAKLFKKIVK